MTLWNRESEIEFFTSTLDRVASAEKLFYHLESGYYAYVPKAHKNIGSTLQSRNTLIGHYTETWCKKLLEPVARKHHLYALNTVECPEIGLPRQSEADLAFCTTNERKQTPRNIKLIFEIKMSIVSNYKYRHGDIEYFGDYKTHRGLPSLLRSDSMLKAIGKSLNIRVSEKAAHNTPNIPIIVLGNSPISKGYAKKVDYLKKSGVLEGFWSLCPTPAKSDFIKETEGEGFLTIQNIDMLESLVDSLLTSDLNYFSGMLPLGELGKIIENASKEKCYIGMANRFLSLLEQGWN